MIFSFQHHKNQTKMLIMLKIVFEIKRKNRHGTHTHTRTQHKEQYSRNIHCLLLFSAPRSNANHSFILVNVDKTDHNPNCVTI